MATKRVVKYVYSDQLIKEADKNPAVKGRASMTHELLRSFRLLPHMQLLPAKSCNPADIRCFHNRDYVDQLKKCGDTQESCRNEEFDETLNDNFIAEEYGLGFDCPTWPGIIDYVCAVAGGTMTACEKLCKYKESENPLVIINWTGGWHHAQRDKAAGFCYVNDIVLGILVLRKRFQRVLYIDLDIHHGDGVELAFEVTRSVFTLSFHKYECGYYPGTGSINDYGRFAKGYAANFPYRNGLSGDKFRKYFKRIYHFVISLYNPDVCIIQCGADVIAGDPLGGTQILPSDICDCVSEILAIKLPTLVLGGGGYNFANASRFWAELTATICGQQLQEDIPDNDAYFLNYGPDYSLKISKPAYLKDENTTEYLENCATAIEREETSKKVSAMNFYAYRLMIRLNEDNHILKCRRLFHQFAVDMYVKIETERLTYVRLNQQKLRSEEYIHLRDALNRDGSANNIGRLTILPSTYVGSPRHMRIRAQDAMTYVQQSGRPDLFITFTCNPKWIEITQLLLPNQSPSDRHDITARLFKQKLKALIDFIVKYHVFGDVRCWIYSVEWQKRGLPHAHILLWMVEKIRPDEIDVIISAEFPDPEADLELYEVVMTNMIHGPCGNYNRESPCMIENKFKRSEWSRTKRHNFFQYLL